MTKPRFLIDVDEVLADFAGPAVGVLTEVLGRPWSFEEMRPGQWDMFAGLSPDQFERVWEVVGGVGWQLRLLPYPDTQEAVECLKQHCEVYVVTSAISWADLRLRWLDRYFSIDSDHVVFTRAKYVVRGDFFLDDHPGHVRSWQKHHPRGVGMLWTSPNNRHLEGTQDIRVHGWDVVIDKVRKWKPAKD